MDKGTIKIPKELTEALKRLDYNSLFYNRRVVRSYCNPITKMKENKEIPAISHFMAKGDADDVSLFQYLTLMALHAYDEDNEEREKIDEHFRMFLRE